MAITFEYKGSDKTEKALKKMLEGDMYRGIEQICQKGVEALRQATPVDEGTTAAAWAYEIERSRGGLRIIWTNSHVNKGAPIAILLQYGHGTGTGGWVSGRDYINPAMRPIFDEIADTIWKAVTSA